MTENLHELLEQDEPVALLRIEKALAREDVQNETVETVISALIWRRCTQGNNGVLGAFIHRDCAARVSVLALHLDRVGASDAAGAVRQLRGEIPLEDRQVRYGLIDWVDAHPDLVRQAERLDAIEDIAAKVWRFMQDRQDDLPDPEIPDKSRGLFARMFGE